MGVLTIRSSRLLRKRDEFVSLLAARNIPVNPNFNQIAFMPFAQELCSTAAKRIRP